MRSASGLLGIPMLCGVLCTMSHGAVAKATTGTPLVGNSHSAVTASVARGAARLSELERGMLTSGQRVERSLEFRSGASLYVGGVAYQVVRADAAAVLGELSNVENLRDMLPNTLSARVVSRGSAEHSGSRADRSGADRSGADRSRAELQLPELDLTERGRGGLARGARPRDLDLRVEMEQGVSPFTARYTVIMRPSAAGEVRFWLDKGAPHDIEDVWGFFRVTPFGKHSLLTVAAAIDLGSGLVGALFRDRVQALALRSATSIRDFVEPRYARAPLASAAPFAPYLDRGR